ncbi:MAG: hypothetical protein IT513_05325 [Burkholderiales bacterium]|nr:hypothetical protein [Burkholderiales bacterium]
MSEQVHEGVREHPGRQARRRFMIGKYEIIAQPIAGSAHMLRYTVFVGGRRVGATASMPTESDCRYLERPPVVPPLKPFQVFYRPGRPKKGTPPPQQAGGDVHHGLPRDDIPAGIAIPARSGEDG